MRWIAAAFFGLLAFAPPIAAHAQKSEVQATVSAEHIAAARQTLIAMILETGSLENGTRLAFSIFMPQLRTSFESMPAYTSTTPARRQAVGRALDAFANGATEEVVRNFPAVAERYAPQIAALFSETELADMARFVRTEHGRSFMVHGVAQGVIDSADASANPANYTDEELQALAEFGLTEGGQAWERNAAAFNPILGEIGEVAVSSVTDRIRARLMRDVCAALESDCPQDMRDGAATYSNL